MKVLAIVSMAEFEAVQAEDDATRGGRQRNAACRVVFPCLLRKELFERSHHSGMA